MKSTRILAAAVAACLTMGVATAAEWSVKPKVTSLPAQPERVLLVGNSFMYYNCGVNGYLSGLNRAKGVKMRSTMATIGGAGLDWHLVKTYLRPDGLSSYSTLNDGSNRLVFNKFPDGKVFDAVVLQDNSQGPVHPELAKFFKKYAAIHSKDIRETGAEPLFLMTWAYADRPEMTKQLADATTAVANENNAMVIPVGIAFAKSLEGRPNLKLTVADNRHPTAAGTYLEAAVMFAALTKSSPEGADYLGGCEKPLAKEDAAWLQSVAWQTVKEFYGW
ncbi:DUF4886 domain-containing protein [Sutterella sp.]|uniref:DUF4886 domain-containing protein n=1 Tax=Sutterella sp. TaxID=1981025 RepID=UPI0026DF6A6D|nr:DUF4886 domain-containing protein [Sutterella sp.]MDO5531881.1 hypothetical protein [Sutterella sp.]